MRGQVNSWIIHGLLFTDVYIDLNLNIYGKQCVAWGLAHTDQVNTSLQVGIQVLIHAQWGPTRSTPPPLEQGA